MAVPDFVAVTNAIAGISISGMKNVYTLANIPDVFYGRDCPALILEGVSAGQDERLSVGQAGGAYYASTFTLDYTFCYAEVGSDRTAATLIAAAEAQLTLVINAIRDNDTAITGVKEIIWASRGPMGVVTDLSGRQFVGCPIGFNVTQDDNL